MHGLPLLASRRITLLLFVLASLRQSQLINMATVIEIATIKKALERGLMHQPKNKSYYCY